MVDKSTILQIIGALMKRPQYLSETDKYNLTPEAEINAISVRVDNGEPCYSVLAELLPNNYIAPRGGCQVISCRAESEVDQCFSSCRTMAS